MLVSQADHRSGFRTSAKRGILHTCAAVTAPRISPELAARPHNTSAIDTCRLARARHARTTGAAGQHVRPVRPRAPTHRHRQVCRRFEPPPSSSASSMTYAPHVSLWCTSGPAARGQQPIDDLDQESAVPIHNFIELSCTPRRSVGGSSRQGKRDNSPSTGSESAILPMISARSSKHIARGWEDPLHLHLHRSLSRPPWSSWAVTVRR
jgi:hypothetical protein